MEMMPKNLFELFMQGGIVALVLVLWWRDKRDTSAILDRYKADMAEQREMYRNNVELVKVTQQLAKDQHDVMVLNIQAMQKLTDAINTNQFCPMVRLEKRSSEL